ncbi:MAG: AAA family ATPase [Weeksellaceae bacterium]|nr:AAA family ATPase [Weeksellaceae bacterium]
MKVIVLTGGPCAGKTTALSRIVGKFTTFGYQVYTVPEMAGIMHQLGFGFATNSREEYVYMHLKMLQLLLEIENKTRELAAKMATKPLIIQDRGAMDIAAYVEPHEWEWILQQAGITEVDLRYGRYDAVLHMVTTANGAEKYYSLANNVTRTENLQQAREVDRRIQEVWTGHPHLRIFNNSGDFDDKINRILQEISDLHGDPEPIESERKFKVRVTGQLPHHYTSSIEQTYLLSNENEELRVRRRGQNGKFICFHTQKKDLAPGQRLEVETKISPKEYSLHLENRDKDYRVIRKERKCFVWDDHYFELDHYLEPQLDFQILEIEGLNLQEKLTFPPFLELVEEVTDNKAYSNKTLARLSAAESNSHTASQTS